MPEQNNEQHSRRFLLRRIPRRPLKYIAILPAMITLFNGISGFGSLMFTSKAVESIARGGSGERYFMFAAYMIMMAMIADMLDGRVARMSRTTSSFGGQLDSLCDVISFGAAPAFLAVQLLAYRLAAAEVAGPHLAIFLYRMIWLAGAIYVSCAAIRLARFNVENEEDESAHMSFSGLPSPAAAGVIMSLIILYVDLPTERWLKPAVWQWGQHAIVVLLPAAVVVSGLMMVSRFRYPHVLNQLLRGKKPLATLLKVFALIAMVIMCFEVVLTLVFAGFAASGPVRWLYHRFILHHKPEEPAPETGEVSNQTAETAE